MPHPGSVLLALALALGAQLHAAPPAFTDVTAAAGINATQIGTGYPQEGWMMGGFAAADFNRDGFADLYLVRGGDLPDLLALSNGDGTFTDASAAWGIGPRLYSAGVAVGDINHDGRIDIYVTTHGDPVNGVVPGRHCLFLNTGESFLEVAHDRGVSRTSPAIADGFSPSFGDYDLDGDLDLAVAGWRGQSNGNRLFRNDGTGHFTDVTTTAIAYSLLPVRGFTPRFFDMDGDRYPELLWVADFETSRYLRNNRDGTFTEITGATGTALDQNGMGTAVGDFDGDNHFDWYVTSIHGAGGLKTGNKLYMHQGDHLYTEEAETRGVDDGGWGWGTEAIDVDHDADLDLVEANGWVYGEWLNENVKLYVNDGTGHFSENAQEAGLIDTGLTRGVIQLDYDADGDQDILIGGYQVPVRLFRNEISGDDAHWLRIRFDTTSHDDLAPDGIGTLIRATTGTHTQVRLLDGGSSYLAVSEFAVHIGLGAATVIDRLVIEWPNGRLNRFDHVAADQSMVVAPCFIDGDADGNRVVDTDDLTLTLQNWGVVDTPYRRGDTTGDGAVNFLDLNVVLDAWGSGCPEAGP